MTGWEGEKSCSFKNEWLDGCKLHRESLKNQQCDTTETEKNRIYCVLTKGDVRCGLGGAPEGPAATEEQAGEMLWSFLIDFNLS